MFRGRVLCVDDEPNLLEAIQRVMQGQFEITIAHGGEQGMAIVAASEPFDVVVSDLRMPVVDGVSFLRHVAERSPDTVRILLTGHADVQDAVSAVNEGRIFRFLTKPCPASTLRAAIVAGVHQHHLVTAERVLLEQTLRGSIRALAEMVSLVHPVVAARTSRIRRLVLELGDELEVEDLWRIEIAALLSNVGLVTLPRTTVDRLHQGLALTPQEEHMLQHSPEAAARVVANIPRLDEVQSVLMHQRTHWDGARSPVPGVAGAAIPIGARLIRAATDFDLHVMRGETAAAAWERMSEYRGCYDPMVLQALHKMRVAAGSEPRAIMVRVRQLREGMVFAEDLANGEGVLLVAKGQEVTAGLLERIAEYWDEDSRSLTVAVYDRAQAETLKRAA